MKSTILYWIPRILTILSILFMTMFSLDSFEGNQTLGAKMLGFLIHNIPVLILTAVLIIAWKWEVAGGILFILASLVSFIYFHSFSGNPGSIVVIAPFLIAGILFILNSVLYERDPVRK
jgi:hypothetical protein